MFKRGGLLGGRDESAGLEWRDGVYGRSADGLLGGLRGRLRRFEHRPGKRDKRGSDSDLAEYRLSGARRRIGKRWIESVFEPLLDLGRSLRHPGAGRRPRRSSFEGGSAPSQAWRAGVLWIARGRHWSKLVLRSVWESPSVFGSVLSRMRGTSRVGRWHVLLARSGASRVGPPSRVAGGSRSQSSRRRLGTGQLERRSLPRGGGGRRGNGVDRTPSQREGGPALHEG